MKRRDFVQTVGLASASGVFLSADQLAAKTRPDGAVAATQKPGTPQEVPGTGEVPDWVKSMLESDMDGIGRTVSLMSRRLRKAYQRAELKTLEGGLWHPWRRKWATERKGMPLKDVAAAGGWRDTPSNVRNYHMASGLLWEPTMPSLGPIGGFQHLTRYGNWYN